MNEKKVLTHLIRAGRDAINLENVLNQFGYKETPYFNLYGEIAEAIYAMLGEDTKSFDQSITHAVMHDPLTPDEVCAEELAKLLEKASKANTHVSATTQEVIQEAAQKRGIDPDTMVRLIINEWAMKEMYANSMMR